VPYSLAGAGTPSRRMWPGPRSTSVPSGILIHPAVWPTCMGRKLGVVPFLREVGAWSPCNPMWPGPVPTSVPSGILTHSAIWHNRHGPKSGGGLLCRLPFSPGRLGPHLTRLGSGLPAFQVATTDMDQKLGAAVPFSLRVGAGSHRTQCGLGRELPPCQVAGSLVGLR